MLSDEQHAILVVDREHADGEVREMDDPVDPGRAVGPGDFVVPDRDPRVLVGGPTAVAQPWARGDGVVLHAPHRRTARASAWTGTGRPLDSVSMTTPDDTNRATTD